MNVIEEIAAERKRQIKVEGWSSEHDDKYKVGELASAAAGYVSFAALIDRDRETDGHRVPRGWPWAAKWWKPTTRRRDLVKAGALIVAEIERLDRIKG